MEQKLNLFGRIFRTSNVQLIKHEWNTQAGVEDRVEDVQIMKRKRCTDDETE